MDCKEKGSIVVRPLRHCRSTIIPHGGVRRLGPLTAFIRRETELKKPREAAGQCRSHMKLSTILSTNLDGRSKM